MNRKVVEIHLLRLLAIGFIAVVLGACGILGGDKTVSATIEVGQFFGSVEIEAPEVVTRGQEFQVTVQTYVGSCDDKGPTKVEINQLEAEIRPYTIERTQSNCDSAIRSIDHTATLKFEQVGVATIAIFGRSQFQNLTGIKVTRSVTV